jgi:hypothetical protein
MYRTYSFSFPIAKIFVYLEWENLANVFFGIFALVWYIVRWGFYSYNILYSVYVYAYLDIVEPIFSQHESKNLRAGGLSPNTWWWLWQIFSGFLVLLFILHLYWGYLIGRMVLKALSDGNVEKDIRSESEDEAPSMISEKDHKSPSIGQTKTRRRRAPKAE